MATKTFVLRSSNFILQSSVVPVAPCEKQKGGEPFPAYPNTLVSTDTP